jgi:hypothetical protein
MHKMTINAYTIKDKENRQSTAVYDRKSNRWKDKHGRRTDITT